MNIKSLVAQMVRLIMFAAIASAFISLAAALKALSAHSDEPSYQLNATIFFLIVAGGCFIVARPLGSKPSIEAMVAMLCGAGIAVISNLFYWQTPAGLTASPWLTVVGTLTGAFCAAAGWADRHDAE